MDEHYEFEVSACATAWSQNVDNERRAKRGATTHFRVVPIADRGTGSPN